MGQIPLLVLAYRYDELRPDAVASGLIRVDSAAGRVYDGPNFRTSPYQQQELFATALAGQLSAQGEGSVYVGSDLWLGTSPPPASLTIDFGDGHGPRTVAMNSTVYLNIYETPPTPTPEPALQSRQLKAGASLAASTGQHTIAVTNPATRLQAFAAYTTLTASLLPPDMALGLKASHTWDNQPAAAAVGWVKWGDGNSSGKFRRPVVFVEGIDFGCSGSNYCTILRPTQTGPVPASNTELAFMIRYNAYHNGSAGWNEMVEYNQDFPSVEKLPALREQLTQQGYDVIYLDFTDGATHIQSNAMTLVELLDYINNPANRAPGATETIVTAASMGGQVARFALA